VMQRLADGGHALANVPQVAAVHVPDQVFHVMVKPVELLDVPLQVAEVRSTMDDVVDVLGRLNHLVGVVVEVRELGRMPIVNVNFVHQMLDLSFQLGRQPIDMGERRRLGVRGGSESRQCHTGHSNKGFHFRLLRSVFSRRPLIDS
jgi:hypothetical protein